MKNQEHSNIIFQFNNASIRINNEICFSNTNWKVLKNQHWVILGPNGSGKTTLIRAIFQKARLAEGEICFPFFTIKTRKKDSQPQQHICHVSPETYEQRIKKQGGFYQSRWNSIMDEESETVVTFLSRNLTSNLKMMTHAETFDRTLQNVIELLNIHSLLNKKIIQLSNGESRKIILADILMKQPEILILSNPFMGLDKEFRKTMDQILSKLMQAQISIIVVADNPKEIPKGITHVLQVKNHSIVGQGPLAQPLTGNFFDLSAWEEKTQFNEKQSLVFQPSDKTISKGPVLVEMKGVNVSYGDQKILNDITWSIRKNEHWALTGPNGSGKSTILGLIFGDHPQCYANKIKLFGTPRGSGESIWDIKKRIGFVSPELHSYYPGNFTALQVVCSGFFDSIGFFRSCSRDQEQKAHHWMETLGITLLKTALFGSLSKGEQQITLIARALVKSPELLLLDEPCQNLDPVNLDRVQTVITRAVFKQESTLVYVTHIPEEIPGFITHELVLEKGHISRTVKRNPG